MGNNEGKSRFIKRTAKVIEGMDKKSIKEIKAENLRKRVEELKKQGCPPYRAIEIAKGEMAERSFRAEEQLKRIPLAQGDFNMSEGLASSQAGYKAERSGSRAKVEYGLREYAEANMPEWLQAGEELIYPEKLDSWKKRLESTAKGKVHGFDITNAIEIMRILDSDVDVKDVVEKYRTKRAYGSYVTQLVLEFSKKGPEYVEQFMSVAGVELTSQMIEKLEALKAENRQYAENELARNRATKADKTEELARASSQLDELATENRGKDTNQAVQE